jgi:transposase InsO family protein
MADDELKQLYLQPDFGLLSAQKFYEKLKNRPGLRQRYTLAQVKDFLSKQSLDQRWHQRRIPRNSYYPIVSHVPFYRLQADFLILKNDFPEENSLNGKPTQYLFTCIDTFTRYAWAIPTSAKNSIESLRCMKKIDEDIVTLFGYDAAGEFLSDNESAWRGPAFENFLRSIGRWHVKVKDDYRRKGIIERFNRTIRGYIRKYCITTNRKRWIDILDDLVKNYNETIHREISIDPKTAINYNPDYELTIAKQIRRANKLPYARQTLRVGDKVRALIDRYLNKANPIIPNGKEDARWSAIVYKISRIVNLKYYIRQDEDKPELGPYKKYQLQKVNVRDEELKNQHDAVDIQDERKYTNELQRVAQELNLGNYAVARAVSEVNPGRGGLRGRHDVVYVPPERINNKRKAPSKKPSNKKKPRVDPWSQSLNKTKKPNGSFKFCQARKENGFQCKLPPIHGSIYCKWHQDYEAYNNHNSNE